MLALASYNSFIFRHVNQIPVTPRLFSSLIATMPWDGLDINSVDIVSLSSPTLLGVAIANVLRQFSSNSLHSWIVYACSYSA